MAKEEKITEEVKNEEVTEEVVQAVAEAITDEAKESNKSIEKVVEEIVDESKPSKKLDKLVIGRGFKSYDEAVKYSKSDTFKKLHVLDQDEFNSWLKKLK